MCELITFGHKRMRARNFQQLCKTRQTSRGRRNERGVQLIEMMVSITVGTLLLVTAFNTASAMYRMTSSSENQVLATNMAQQLIDNARNTTYTRLLALAGGVSSSASVSQDVSLYDYPSNPAAAAFPRPLLRNESNNDGLSFQTSSRNKRFNGTVTETLRNLTPGEANNGMIRVDIAIRWTDSRGPHSYSTGTVISQTGIHN